MKEDVLEQVVDDYLRLTGYFTRANIRYKPRAEHPEYTAQQDSVASDIDVLGVNPLASGAGRVWAVSCKSWQGGMAPVKVLADLQAAKVCRQQAAHLAVLPRGRQPQVERGVPRTRRGAHRHL